MKKGQHKCNFNGLLFLEHHPCLKSYSARTYITPHRFKIDRLLYQKVNMMRFSKPLKEQGFDPFDIDLAKPQLYHFAHSYHHFATFHCHGNDYCWWRNSTFRSRGVINQANLTASDFSNILPDNILVFNSNAIHVQNHSYWVGIENYLWQ